jgi:hypothetical protein
MQMTVLPAKEETVLLGMINKQTEIRRLFEWKLTWKN